MELQRVLSRLEATIRQHIGHPHVEHCKVSLWIKFVRQVPADGSLVEETVGPVQQMVLTVNSYDELVRTVAENMALAVFGSELQLVDHLPNLIVKIFDRKALIPMPGNPPVDQPDQLFLKATVFRYEPGLWKQLFHRHSPKAE